MKAPNYLIILILISTSLWSQKTAIDTLEVRISTSSVEIQGTLLKPTSSKKVPLCIIIPGSGPTDRNGNNPMMKNNSLKFLAEELATNNIATYRFDKSVIHYTKEQKQQIDSLKFQIFIDEAIAIINYFKLKKEYSKIIVIGHSQGSLVGMIAGKNLADAFISIAGTARTIDEVLVEQIEKQAPYLKEETLRIVTELKKGKTVNDFNPLLTSLFNKSIQPFLISWMKFNPSEEIKKLKIPILLINGSKDIQVPTNDAVLLQKANPISQLNIIENMNHVFKEINGDSMENMASYSNPKMPIMTELSTIITTFVNEK